MTRFVAGLFLLLATACAPEPKVVVRSVLAEPAPPSADLLVEPAPTVTAGSANVAEVLARLANDNKRLRIQVLGLQLWVSDLYRSIREANGGQAKP